ncbi:hypothetical protein EDC04DRAFT_3141121, partial [Pisolithus marmoratus]
MHPHIPPWPLAPHNHGHLSSTKHPYGTRARKNSVLRPSTRLRHSSNPPPRRLRPVPTSPAQKQHEDPLSTFPLPNIMLHPEDASSKVLQAIGRSFLSVDNRAMTIKDLAEMALKFGLMCQNVSAASQAITTYIRNHLSRCDAQQDHPLLLRHVLSGTPADDELAPALYSRYGADSSDSDVEEGRPPKVKVTPRLRPSSAVLTSSPPTEVIDLSAESLSSGESNEDVSMQLALPDAPWSLPPYPRRSITVPSHASTCNDSVRTRFPYANARRSPSVPSSASPPPDSDRGELDVSFDAETDFDWDSSSISIASPTVLLRSIDGTDSESPPEVKQEPQDSNCRQDDVNTDEFEFWEWEFEGSWSHAAHPEGDMYSTDTKVDIGEPRNLSTPLSLPGVSYSPGPGFPVSPCSSHTPSSSSFHSSVSPTSDVSTDSSSRWPMPPSPPLSPLHSSAFTLCPPFHVSSADGALTWQDTELLGPDSVHPE